MDLSRFRTSDWLKIGGGTLFFIAGFLTWWQAEAEVAGIAQSETKNAFDYFFTGILPWLIFIAIAVTTFLVAAGRLRLPPNVQAPAMFLVAAALATLLFLIRFFVSGATDSEEAAIDDLGGEISRGVGLWLGLIGALAVLAGCLMAFTESGRKLADLADRDTYRSGTGSGYGSGTSTPPPPPPPAP